MRALGCKSVWRLTQVVCTIGRQGKWGELSATFVVAGSSQSPHSSALMTYDDNEEQNRLLDQSLGVAFRTIMNVFIKELRVVFVALVHDLGWGSTV